MSSSENIHVIHPSELEALVNELNLQLAKDPEMASRTPVSPPDNLWDASSDGLIFAHLLNAIHAGSIDLTRLNRVIKTPHHAIENQNSVLHAAVSVGCKITNIGAVDLMKAKENHTQHLVLGLLWQIIKAGLMSKLTVTLHPELIRLMQPGEELSAFLSLPPEHLLMRWVNYHLTHANAKRSVNNFSSDVSDSEVYAVLLTQIAPDMCDFSVEDIVAEGNLLKRAEHVLTAAGRLNCRKFVTPPDIVSGHSRLNLAFVAHLFNTHPGIQLPSEEELRMLNQSKSQLVERLHMMQQEVDAQGKIILQTREKSEKMEKELADIQVKYSTLESENVQLRDKLASLTAEFEGLSQERDLLTELSSELQETLDGLNAQMSQMKEEREREKGEREKEREKERAERESIEKKVEEVKEQLQQVTKDKETLEDQLATLRHKHACFENQYQALVDKLTAQLASSTEARATEQEEFEHRLRESEARTQDAVSQVLGLKDQIYKLTSALVAVTKERDEARAQAAAYVNANERGLAAYEQLRGNQEGAMKLIQELTTQNHVLAEEKIRFKDATDKAIAALHEEIDKLKRELKSTQIEKEDWKRKWETLDAEYKSLDKRNNAHRAMLNHLSQQIQRNETHISHLKSLYNSYPSSKKLFHAIYPDRSRTMFEAKNGPYERHLTLHGALMRPSADKTKEAKLMHYLLVDNFLLAYKPGEDSKPHDVVRLDDAEIESGKNFDSTFIISITPAHHGEELYQIQVENEPQKDAWVGVMKIASEWWTDNKQKRGLNFVVGPGNNLPVEEF